MSLWARIRQVLRIARQTWQLQEARAMVISYHEEPERTMIFPDDTRLAEINKLMQMIYSGGGFARHGEPDSA